MNLPERINYNAAAVTRILETLENGTPEFRLFHNRSYAVKIGLSGQTDLFCGCARGAIRWDMYSAGKLKLRGCDLVPPQEPRACTVDTYTARRAWWMAAESMHLGVPTQLVRRMEQYFEGFSRRGVFGPRSGPQTARWLRRALRIQSPVQAKSSQTQTAEKAVS